MCHTGTNSTYFRYDSILFGTADTVNHPVPLCARVNKDNINILQSD